MNKNEPAPSLLVSANPPAWVKGKARKSWAQIASILIDLRVLTGADVPGLAMVCDALAEYIESRAVVQKQGMVYESKSVKIVHTSDGDKVEIETLMLRARPEVGIAQDAWRRAMAGLQQFGLTPASRSKVQAIPSDKEGDDPMEKLLRESGV